MVASYNFTYDWYCTGSPGASIVDLYSDGSCDISGYSGTWGYGSGEESGFADGLCPGTIMANDFWFMFDNYATQYVYDMDDEFGSGIGIHDDMYYNGMANVDGTTFCDLIGDDTGCSDGYVDDCSGDGDCCPESWIGDGFEDCEDQAFGCDLTCYANDGGDCDGGNPDDDIYTELDMMANGGVYDFTYDWYCTGSPGTAQVALYWDGESECRLESGCPASIDGYDGLWGVNAAGGSIPFADGLCPGLILDWDFGFAFTNYATFYNYDLSVADDGSLFGGGVHDDVYYNGPWNVDGTSSIASGEVVEGCPDGYVDDCSGDGDCCAESWIGDGFEDCEDQAWGCDLTCYDNDGGDCAPECAQGDINCDAAIDVIDVVLLVNAIIDGEALDNGDMNSDGSLDVIDVVILVNAIINGEGRAMDAESATVIETANSLTVKGDGYIGGIQITLSHDNGFELN